MTKEAEKTKVQEELETPGDLENPGDDRELGEKIREMNIEFKGDQLPEGPDDTRDS